MHEMTNGGAPERVQNGRDVLCWAGLYLYFFEQHGVNSGMRRIGSTSRF